jgi:hypothetical protein
VVLERWSGSGGDCGVVTIKTNDFNGLDLRPPLPESEPPSGVNTYRYILKWTLKWKLKLNLRTETKEYP